MYVRMYNKNCLFIIYMLNIINNRCAINLMDGRFYGTLSFM